MSIAYFPEIYPDELLYSVLARFYLHSGYPIYTMIAEHLFPNTWKKPCIEFVGNLKQEILEIILRDITMEELINKHTMFPYYARFIPKADRLKALESIKNMQSGYMDLLKIPNREPRQLHYCPLCIKEDRQHYGEAYWHRIHQMAGVDVCPIHKCYLKDSGIAIDTFKSSALISIEEMELCTEVIYCNNELENQLAEYIMQIFLEDINMNNEVSVGKFLHGKLNFTKYMAKNGGCRKIQLLYNDFKEFFGDNMRYGITELWQMQCIFMDTRVNLYEICQMAVFLKIPVEEMLNMKLPERTQQMIFDETVRELRAKGLGYNKIGEMLGVSSLTVRKVGKYEQRKPKNYKIPCGSKRRDWEKIDKETLPLVKSAIAELYGDEERRPRKINRNAVCDKLGLNKCIFRCLPQCTKEIAKYSETQEQYWAREIIWAICELEREGKVLSASQIMRVTNMRKDNLIASLPHLKEIEPELAEVVESLL
ncbi:MAG: TniQ family protein [Lachnospiraceae bacterium]|nr:TniQ family protein [Lachnospiraceae bacterium]